VTEQLPPEVIDRRRSVIPKVLRARIAGKKTVLVRDKLFINNQMYAPTTKVEPHGKPQRQGKSMTGMFCPEILRV
jgi:hypothetical protein